MATRLTKGQLRLAESFEAQRSGAYETKRKAARFEADRRVKIVAEGDSWFSYFPACDVLAQLRRRSWDGVVYDIEDRAKGGALLNDMVYGRDMVDTYQLLEKHRPRLFLFSGGGNDIAGQELFVMLYNKKAVEMHAALPRINRKIIEGLVDEVFRQAYLDMIAMIRWKAGKLGLGELPIVMHGYDYAIPDGRGWAGGLGPLPGPWLDPSLTRKGYDRDADVTVRRDIVRQLIDAFNEMLKKIAGAVSNIHHVDLRGTLRDSQWGNELHPTEAGFKAVAARIEQTLRKI
jgi:lysophospholipase L1-like esterase